MAEQFVTQLVVISSGGCIYVYSKVNVCLNVMMHCKNEMFASKLYK